VQLNKLPPLGDKTPGEELLDAAPGELGAFLSTAFTDSSSSKE
jgi:hypothetical protein